MDPVFRFLSGFPVLLLHFAVTMAMLALGITIYHFVTPYHGLHLVRSGNTAAAVSLAIVGMAIPLAICMATSVSVWDIVIWGVVTLLIQILAYRIADAMLRICLPGSRTAKLARRLWWWA